MRRAPHTLVAIGLVFLAKASLAGWNRHGVAGSPTDVQLLDAGRFAVASSAEARALQVAPDGGVVATVGPLAGTFVGAFERNGCLGALASGGQFSSTCQATYAAFPAGATATRMRHTGAGTAYATGVHAGANYFQFSPSGGLDGGSWAALADNGGLTFFASQQGMRAISALRVGAADYAVFTVLNPGVADVLVVQDSAIVGGIDRGSVQPRGLALFDNGGRPGAIVVPGDGGLELVSDLLNPTFEPVTLPAAAGEVYSAAFTLEGGDAFGRGFGVAVGRLADGSVAVFRAVPDPSRPGATWVLDSRPPPAAGLARVGCLDPRFCVALSTDAGSTENVLAYWNQSRPTVPPVGTVDSGTVLLPVTDDDGDAVFVTWVPLDAGYPTVERLDPEGRQVRITPALGAGCSPAAVDFPFDVHVSDGLAPAVSQRVIVQARGTPAGVSAVTHEPLIARCGEPVRGTFTAEVGPELCQSQELSWRQTGGPALETPVAHGTSVELTTASAELDELVGQRLELEVSADAGPGNVAQTSYSAQISAEPFVAVAHRFDSPIAREARALGVAVTLTNTSECRVRSVELREDLGGLRYLSGSARLDGQPIDLEDGEDALVVRAIELAPRQSVTLTFSARARLLGEHSPRAQALLNGVPISLAREPTGCGCAAGAGPAWIAVVGLLGLARRMRQRARALPSTRSG